MRLLRLAVSTDGNDPDALAGLGRITAYLTGDFDAATEMVDRAVVLNPNSWIAWEQRGETFNVTGNFEEAIRSFEHAIRLSPLDPFLFVTYTSMGLAFIGLGRFDEAIVAAKKALRKNPLFSGAYRCLASALGHLSREVEAREAAVSLLKLEPNFHISEWTAGRWRSEKYVDGLRKAGLPE
jgi:adenylate cyclase